MYISRMAVNGARAEARRLIASPYRLHSAVEHAFPPTVVRSGDEGRVLWRLDAPSTGGPIWLYIVSPARPDMTHLVEQAGWPSYSEGDAWETKDYTPLLDRLQAGQRWQFRLKANPVRKVVLDQGRTPNQSVVGTLQGHVTVAQQTAWLLARAEVHGFSVLSDGEVGPAVSVSQRYKERFRRGDGEVTLSTAVFDGLLQILDADLFRNTLCRGMGRAKGFGCGLLTIAPSSGGR